MSDMVGAALLCNESRRICLVCACWDPTGPSAQCSHPEIAILNVDDLDMSVLSGFAKAAARAERQRNIALGALRSFVQDHESAGSARVQATHVDVQNVVSLKLRPSSVRVG